MSYWLTRQTLLKGYMCDILIKYAVTGMDWCRKARQFLDLKSCFKESESGF